MEKPSLIEKSHIVVTICGGGNGGHVCAGYLGSKSGFEVNMLTRRPGKWAKKILVQTEKSSWKKRGTIIGSLHRITSNASEVIPKSDIVIIAAPANVHANILTEVAPHMKPTAVLGTIYAQGGFHWAASKAFGGDMSKIHAMFGLQNIPWLCRTIEYGVEVSILGPKRELWAAVTPISEAKDIAEFITFMFDIPTKCVPNFLSLTLTPSNQIIHPGRYYGIFKDWDGKTPMEEDAIQWGLYSQMDDYSASWMSRLDEELQKITMKLKDLYPSLDLSYVVPLGERIKRQYGNDIGDTTNLKTIFATNRAYKGCVTPAMRVEKGFYPALESRLFWEDIPAGLCVLKNIAEMLNLETPKIDFMIEWHQQYMHTKFISNGTLLPQSIKSTTAPAAYGIHTLDALVASSLPQVNGEKAVKE